MRIALIAHDSRKELMAQFCTAYVRILSENELVATGVTGKIVHDATGLPVRCLYPGGRGGDAAGNQQRAFDGGQPRRALQRRAGCSGRGRGGAWRDALRPRGMKEGNRLCCTD